MNHLDLFSGIGGFAYAVDQVWPGSTHVFCDNNEFCQKVIKKHWPESRVYGDIRTITDTNYNGFYGTQNREGNQKGTGSYQKRENQFRQSQRSNPLRDQTNLLTGGFPCQPFSQAGQRRGTADNRYLWPEMLRVVQITKPAWIIGENVSGLITWNKGMVLEQVCLDLENEGYEVQPFVIPACAKNAPHRRDRVWIIAHSTSERGGGSASKKRNNEQKWQLESDKQKGSEVWGENKRRSSHVADSKNERVQGHIGEEPTRTKPTRQSEWDENWLEVATRLCRMDDGVSSRVDRLKALGNAIVPQVAIEIMKAIKET